MQFRPRLKIYKSSSGKNTYEPETKEFRSYSHWCYAKFICGTWVFNQYRYSVTTARHQREGWALLVSELGVRESDIVEVIQSESLGKGIVLDDAYERLYKLELKLKNERVEKRKGEIIETLAGVRANIARLRKLGGKASTKLATLKKYTIESELKRLADNREKNRASRIAYVAKRKELEREHGQKLTDVSEVSI